MKNVFVVRKEEVVGEKLLLRSEKRFLFGMKEGVFGMQEHVLDMSMLVVRRILVFADRTDGVFVLQEVVAGEKRFCGGESR